MVTIDKNNELTTLIVVFTVEPTQQQQLIEDIVDNLENVVKQYAGFISSTIHKSLDGKQVVNYVQWKTRADFEAYLKNAPRFFVDYLKGPPQMNVYQVDYQSGQ